MANVTIEYNWGVKQKYRFELNLSAMVRRIASSIRWVSQEPFLIRIAVALLMKGGWMNFVLRIEMMKSRRRCKCHLR